MPRALALIVRTPQLRRLAVAPALLSVLLFLGMLWASVHWSGALLQALWPGPGVGAGGAGGWSAVLAAFHALAHFLVAVFLGLLSLVLALLISFVIGEPFVDLLAEATEKCIGCARESELRRGLFRGMARDLFFAVVDTAVDLGLFLVVQAALLLLYLVPGAGVVFHLVLGFLVSGVFCAAAMTASTLCRRGCHGVQRWRWLRRELPRMLGLGCGVMLLLAAPLLQVATLPCAAVAGTLAVCDAERARAAPGGGGGGSAGAG